MVSDVLDRRSKRIAKAQAIIDQQKEDSDEELLNIDVRSPAWLGKGSSNEPDEEFSSIRDRYTQPRKDLKLDTLEDLLNYK